MNNNEATIAALATHPGMAAIAVIRICGPNAFEVLNEVFRPVGGKTLKDAPGYSSLFGKHNNFYQRSIFSYASSWNAI
jgi:tRNA modification GTPase